MLEHLLWRGKYGIPETISRFPVLVRGLHRTQRQATGLLHQGSGQTACPEDRRPARAGRTPGTPRWLAARQARKLIGEIYEIANREPLPSDTIADYFHHWTERLKITHGHKTAVRYGGIVKAFLEWLGEAGRQRLLIQLESAEPVRFRDQYAKTHSPASVNTAAAGRAPGERVRREVGYVAQPEAVVKAAQDHAVPSTKRRRMDRGGQASGARRDSAFTVSGSRQPASSNGRRSAMS